MPVSFVLRDKPNHDDAGTRRWAAPACVSLVGITCLALLLAPWHPEPVRAAPALQEPAAATPLPGTGSVAGSVWDDADQDGVKDAGEAPLAGAVVSALDLNSGATSSAPSGLDGEYLIAGLAPSVYRITATPPDFHVLTTRSSYDVSLTAGVVLTFDFGAYAPPTPTPSPTSPPILDTSNAEHLYCGGVYSGDTQTGQNGVSSYGCRPWWDESGKEVVYRLDIDVAQPITVTLLSASADLDLFLLRYAYPDSCVAAGDNYLSYAAQPGAYFLAVDGYRGAAGSYVMRIDCPTGQQATATPTFTPSPTPTATPTGTVTPTGTPLPTVPPKQVYLPLLLRSASSGHGPTVTLTLQDGLNGYAGTSDTTLDSWEPTEAHGAENRLRLFYSRPPKLTTQMAPVLRFGLDLLPAGAQVQAATLRLYLPLTPSHDLRARVQGLLRPWDEFSATWELAATQQGWGVPGALGEGTDRSVWTSDSQQLMEGSRWYEFDVTALAQEWGRDPQRNYGMILAAGAGDADANVEARFVSREGNGNWRPQFVISYTLPAQ